MIATQLSETLPHVDLHPEGSRAMPEDPSTNFGPTSLPREAAVLQLPALHTSDCSLDTRDTKASNDALTKLPADTNSELRHARSLARHYYEQWQKCQADRRQSSLEARQARARERALFLKAADLERRLKTRDTVIALLERGFIAQRSINESLTRRLARLALGSQESVGETETEPTEAGTTPSGTIEPPYELLDEDPFHYDKIYGSDPRSSTVNNKHTQDPSPIHHQKKASRLRKPAPLRLQSTRQEKSRTPTQINNETQVSTTLQTSTTDHAENHNIPHIPRLVHETNWLNEATASTNELGLSCSNSALTSSTTTQVNGDPAKHHIVTLIPRTDDEHTRHKRGCDIPSMIVTSPTLASLAAEVSNNVDQSLHQSQHLPIPLHSPTRQKSRSSENQTPQTNGEGPSPLDDYCDPSDFYFLDEDDEDAVAPLSHRVDCLDDAHIQKNAKEEVGNDPAVVEDIFREYYRQRSLKTSCTSNTPSSSTASSDTPLTVLTQIPYSPISVNSDMSASTPSAMTESGTLELTDIEEPAGPYRILSRISPFERSDNENNAISQSKINASKGWKVMGMMKRIGRICKFNINKHQEALEPRSPHSWGGLFGDCNDSLYL